MRVENLSMKASTVLMALSIASLLLSACAPAPQPTPTLTPTQPPPTPTPQPTATFTPVPPTATPTPIPPTAASTATPTPTATPTSTPTPTPTPDYTALFPPFLPYDWYPNGMTREDILARLPEAVRKTGHVGDETWSGAVRITGDLTIEGTIIVEPGTIIYVAARSDDQHAGIPFPKDEFNPKDPVPDENYVKNRVWINMSPYSRFIARGTPEQPIIITSDSQNPQNDDWQIFSVNEGAKLEMEYTIMEYFRVFSIHSDVKITNSILRNMMECIVIWGQEKNLLDLNPIITQNYIYNCGHICITVLRFASPEITHNVVRARPDMEFPGFEYGAIAFGFSTKPFLEHNFIEGGPPVRYDYPDAWGRYREFLRGMGVNIHSPFGLHVTYNTFYNCSEWGLEVNPYPLEVENNNFISNRVNLMVQKTYEPDPFDPIEQELLRKYPVSPLNSIIVANNYWGTADENKIRKLIEIHGDVKVDFTPYRTAFIKEALPDWSWLKEWLQ